MLTDIRDMHYDFKQKLNKIDSQKYKNLRVPEIDWKLNEAEDIFKKMIAKPRLRQSLGFESFQRNIDDIRPIVKEDISLPVSVFDNISYTATLPDDYNYHISSFAICSKGNCTGAKCRCLIKEHDDRHEDTVFYTSSFEWREVNVQFYDGGIRIFTDGSFTINQILLSYIRNTKYMHNAQSYINGQYSLPNGTVLNGIQNSELPKEVYQEIVDLAVMITTGDLVFDYNVKQIKTQLTN